MRLFLLIQCVLLCVGIGYSFRIPDFLEAFTKQNENSERQSDIDDQIVPVFLVAFFASLVNSLFMMNASSDYYWGYEASNGPSTWGSQYPACNGMKQSPIDITFSGSAPTTMAESTPLTFTNYNNVRTAVLENGEEQFDRFVTNSGEPGHDRLYAAMFAGRRKRQTSSLNNNGHTAQVSVMANSGDGVLSGGPLTGSYNILQFHFHWGKDSSKGSEHTINGKEYPLELHIVHTKDGESDPLNTKKGLAVTGFMFEIDTMDNAALKPLTDALKNVLSSDAELPFQTSGFRIDQLIAGVAPIGNTVTPYSHYEGSLTTPTCNEVVEWINFLTPLKISESQLEMFRAMMDSHGKNIVDNFRPPQALNGRTVEFYGP